MTKQDILTRLASLGLDAGEYWVVAGAAMVLYGLRERTHDIDLGCTPALADRLERQYAPERFPDGTRAFHIGDDVEIFENYRIGPVTAVCGVPAVTLDGLCAMKRTLEREKDLRDVALIEASLPSLALRPAGAGDPAREWALFRDTPPENRWENRWFGCDYETYRAEALPQMQRAAEGNRACAGPRGGHEISALGLRRGGRDFQRAPLSDARTRCRCRAHRLRRPSGPPRQGLREPRTCPCGGRPAQSAGFRRGRDLPLLPQNERAIPSRHAPLRGNDPPFGRDGALRPDTEMKAAGSAPNGADPAVFFRSVLLS